jgi:hypothetical protein
MCGLVAWVVGLTCGNAGLADAVIAGRSGEPEVPGLCQAQSAGATSVHLTKRGMKQTFDQAPADASFAAP